MIDLMTRLGPVALVAAVSIVGCEGSKVPSSEGTTDGGTSTTGASTSTTTSTSTSTSTTMVDDSTTSGSTGTSGVDSGTTGIIPPSDPGCPECVVLAFGLQGGRGIAVDDDYVYWTDETAGTVHRVLKDGGNGMQLAEGQSTPYDIAVDDTHVYWTNFADSGAVMRVAKDGGVPQTVADEVLPRAVEVAFGYVFWGTFGDGLGRLRRRAVTLDAAAEDLAEVFGGVADIAVGSTTVYMTAHADQGGAFIEPPVPTGSIFAVPIMGTGGLPPAAMISNLAPPWGITLSGSTLAWINGDGDGSLQPNSVLMAPVTGMAGEPLAAGQSSPWGIVADATDVYWTDHTEVKTIPFAGGVANVLATEQNNARYITADDTHVFWVTKERVLQRPKP